MGKHKRSEQAISKHSYGLQLCEYMLKLTSNPNMKIKTTIRYCFPRISLAKSRKWGSAKC